MSIRTTYIDKLGTVETEIVNDGEKLTLDIDGTKFTSRFFDDFEIDNKDTKPVRFSLNKNNELTSCRLVCELPLTLTHQGKDIQTVLAVDLYLENKTNAIFTIKIGEKEIKTNTIELFESGLNELKENLPEGYKLKCCYGCSFADYSVYGQGFFGTMLCFRNIKKEYLQVADKEQYMEIMDNHDRLVQETYLCADFQERVKGTGYRH